MAARHRRARALQLTRRERIDRRSGRAVVATAGLGAAGRHRSADPGDRDGAAPAARRDRRPVPPPGVVGRAASRGCAGCRARWAPTRMPCRASTRNASTCPTTCSTCSCAPTGAVTCAAAGWGRCCTTSSPTGSGCDPTVRLWRVSHTGGHRFAPTALTFPDGYGWAHLDLDLALQLVRRDGQVGALLAHCRGVSSLSGPAAQVADREALATNGWNWSQVQRTVDPRRGGWRRGGRGAGA